MERERVKGIPDVRTRDVNKYKKEEVDQSVTVIIIENEIGYSSWIT